MDPNANLAEQRRIVAALQTIEDNCNADGSLSAGQQILHMRHGARLAELVQALDAWVSGGGFLPTAWLASGASAQRVAAALVLIDEQLEIERVGFKLGPCGCDEYGAVPCIWHRLGRALGRSA